MTGLERWGDAQQYAAAPHADHDEASGVVPRVDLLTMTPDPLGAVAAMAAMYEGRVVTSLDQLDDKDRRTYWDQVMATHLDTPLEAVQMHFVLSGVDRAFTHQLVRQRVGAAFAQESLRFAVVEDLPGNTTLPPSLHGTRNVNTPEGRQWLEDEGPIALGPIEQRWRNTWEDALDAINKAYQLLVGSGMPAEEARGLLPHCTATRVHFVTNLRAIKKTAGERLCTQAQFHWRMVLGMLVQAIRSYDPLPATAGAHELLTDMGYVDPRWQYQHIADSGIFRPVCYQVGHCPFKATFDRACTIRSRVDAFGSHGVPSDQWDNGPAGLRSIRTEEWLVNPAAARKTS